MCKHTKIDSCSSMLHKSMRNQALLSCYYTILSVLYLKAKDEYSGYSKYMHIKACEKDEGNRECFLEVKNTFDYIPLGSNMTPHSSKGSLQVPVQFRSAKIRVPNFTVKINVIQSR